MRLFFIILGFLAFARLYAQDKSLLEWDMDTVFDEPLEESPPEDAKTETTATDMLKRQSFIFDASYEFMAGFMPSWRESPWSSSGDRGFFLDRALKIRSLLGMDAQIDKYLRIKSDVYFEIPNFDFKLGDFFFDYNLYDVVFFRGGKYAQSWGISPNYNFTDLLARIPPKNKDDPNESFIFKADIPNGIGGFQFLVMTRADLMHHSPDDLVLDDVGFGGKFNLALSAADFDMGFFYQEGMPLRAFFSVKTTLWKTELYSEGLFAIDVYKPSNVSGAVSLGFAKDFFSGKLGVNGEVFYNAEKDTDLYRPETNIRESGSTRFIDGLNFALNLRYKFSGKGDPRLFTLIRYAPFEKSAQLIPGFTLNPWPHIGFSLAMPMALGDKNGYYSIHTPMEDSGRPIPFQIIMLVTLSGNIKFGFTR